MLISSIIRESSDKAKGRAGNRYVYIGNPANDACQELKLSHCQKEWKRVNYRIVNIQRIISTI